MSESTTSSRWKPVRGGLINLFKYEDQVFRYENGHLLLRGNNGSGKSRVLALQLPFLFDGDMSPYRVEPDRDPAKRMEWHLLMDQYDRRTGYTWIEFGRIDEGGQEHYLTLGCGMEARKGGGAPNRWFFISPERVGHEIELVQSRVPLGKNQLSALFQAHGVGTIYEKASSYRDAVDHALFKLGRQRYLPLIDLLIQLRQPQLMRDLKEDVLSNALSEALPPVRSELVHQVAESFQSLESDRQHTEAHREMRDMVGAFRDGYRQYLSVAVRRLCDIVRKNHNQFESVTKELREIERQSAENEEELRAGRNRFGQAEMELVRCHSEIETLRDSPEMRSMRELESAKQRVDELTREEKRLEEDLASAREGVAAAVGEREKRDGVCKGQEGELEVRHRELATAHQSIAPGQEPLFSWRESALAKERQKIGKLVEERKRAVAHLAKENRLLAQLKSRADQDHERCERRREAIREVEDKLSVLERRLADEASRFGSEVIRWEGALEVLHEKAFERGYDWTEALHEWIAQNDGGFPFARELQKARLIVEREIAGERADLDRKLSEHAEEFQEVQALFDELREGRQLDPPARPTRLADREGRVGAPFWKLFEFREVVPDSEHAGWEAALESSGLLDAWVYPDGRLAAEFGDDDALVLQVGEALEERVSLAAVLEPAESDSMLTALLHRIGNHQQASSCWVARTGHWANGPHTGHLTKQNADYLGHRAREASRQRRIEGLRQELSSLKELGGHLEGQKEALRIRGEMLDGEIDGAPDISTVGELVVKRGSQQEALIEQKQQLLDEEEQAIRSDGEWKVGLAKRDQDAADMNLAGWQDSDRLREFEGLLNDYEKLSLRLWSVWEGYGSTLDELRVARAREEQSLGRAERSEKIYRERCLLAEQARAKAQTLQLSVGASVEELMARLDAAKAAEEKFKEERGGADAIVRKAEVRKGALEEKRSNAGEKRVEAEEHRNHAVARMEVFVQERVLEAVNPAFHPERTSYSTTAAVELARQLEQELRSHPLEDEHWQKLQAELVQSFHEFADQLGRHGLLPRLRSIDESSVSLITCDFQGQTRTLHDLDALLEAELKSRERIFEEREREIIENHLIGEAAAALQVCIREGENWVVKVNRELERVTTSSGIQLKFNWGIRGPEDEQLAATRKIFLKTSAAWTPAERDQIGTFLQLRIRQAQEEDDTVTWREHLGRALDYRKWHQFGILRRSAGDGVWKKLTKRTFGTGSGGEKAMTLTVPQFAAAAAHYQSAHKHAPRLILLDEVFVAIDAETRERLMGLLEKFDMDYVMTSEREWGVYPSVSGLAIYQLSTRQGYDAVAVTRWVWNGREKLRDLERSDETSSDG